MTAYTRDEIKNYLRGGIMQVQFTKVDGTQRTMMCTLNEAYIPSDKKPTGAHVSYDNETLRVYDLQAEGWRSFRVSSVYSVEAPDRL
jgi:hypothetical protein